MGVTIILNFYYQGGFLGACVELPEWPSTYCDYEFEGRKDLTNFRHKDAWNSTTRDQLLWITLLPSGVIFFHMNILEKFTSNHY